MKISDYRPESNEFLKAAAVEMHMLLQRLIEIENDAVAFRIRRLLPIPGLFQPIDFEPHFRSLRQIEIELDELIAQLPSDCRHTPTTTDLLRPAQGPSRHPVLRTQASP